MRALRGPGLADALVFVDSMTLPATVTDDPVHPARNHPLVVKSLGDAADAGFARLFPDRRPLRMQGTRFVPFAVDPNAPLRHEGGALYPLDDARGGFGERGTGPGLGNVTLSGGEALRFSLDGPASFSLPIYALPADAGPMTLTVALVRHPGSPPVDLTVDGVAVAQAVATDGSAWQIDPVRWPIELTPGPHRLEVAIAAGRKGQVLAIDYVELSARR